MKKIKKSKKKNNRRKPINKLAERRNEKINLIIEKRYKIIIGLIIILMIVLMGKLFFMQVVKYDDYQVELKRLTKKIIDGESILPCGAIYCTEKILNVFCDILGKEKVNIKEV